MKSTRLKSIIEGEMLVGASEMTQRFQHLRGFNLLPKDKGQSARDLSPDEIVSGIISVMDVRPGYAGLIVTCTKSLKPVRGINYSYRGAKTLGEVMCLLLDNPDDLVELKIKGIENDDRGIPSYAYGGRAQISYKEDGDEKTSYYVPKTSLSLFGETSQDAIDYDPRKFKAQFEREYVLKGNIFRNIHNYLKQENKHKEIMKDLS